MRWSQSVIRFLEKLYPDMLENDAYFVDMALNDYPILYRSALDPESDQLIRHAYQKEPFYFVLLQ